MNISCINSYSTKVFPSCDKQTFKGTNYQISTLNSDNLSETFDFFVDKINGRGNKQCAFELLYIQCRKPNPKTLFLIAKDNSNQILATASAFVGEGNKETAIVNCYRNYNIPQAKEVQAQLLDKVINFAKKYNKNIFVPAWLNDTDNISLELYKKYNLDVDYDV